MDPSLTPLVLHQSRTRIGHRWHLIKTSILVTGIPCIFSYLFFLYIHLEVKLKYKVYKEWLERGETIPNEPIVNISLILGVAKKDWLTGKSFWFKLFKKHHSDHKARAPVSNYNPYKIFTLVVFLFTFGFWALQNDTVRLLFGAVTGNILMYKC